MSKPILIPWICEACKRHNTEYYVVAGFKLCVDCYCNHYDAVHEQTEYADLLRRERAFENQGPIPGGAAAMCVPAAPAGKENHRGD